MNIKKIICLFRGHKIIGYSVQYTFSNVQRTKCRICGTELQLLTGKGIMGEWKPYQDRMEKAGLFEFHEKPEEWN